MNAPAGWESLGPEAKRELLAQLLRQKADARVFPLSHGQEALWFLHQIAPESVSYNVAFTARVHSPLDVDALERAFTGVVARHEMLRVTFEEFGREPVQRVHDDVPVRIERIDGRAWTAPELLRSLATSYQRPFDLEEGPLFRLTVVDEQDGSSVLMLVIHHIVFDGTSTGVLLHEWFALYGANVSGMPAALTPLAIRYSDFVVWQANLLKSAAGEEMWEYWQRQLKGPLPTVELPLDRPRPAVQSFRGATHSFRIEAGIAQPLRDLARQRGATFYAVLLAAYQVFLHRYTQQDDIVVGSPTAGRSRSEFSGLIGYFVNPVVLRGDLFGDPTFLECIDRARTVVVGALKNADYSFPQLVKRLRPERDPGRSPLFQVEFNLVKTDQVGLAMPEGAGRPSRITMGGLEMTPLALDQQEGQFDLGLEVFDSGESLVAMLKYATDLFESLTIERMAGHLTRLLEGIVASPESRISELPFLTQAEESEVSVCNATSREYPEVCIHELIVARAKKSPSRVAVEMDGSRLSFGELEERSRVLSEHLIGLGVGADVLVGIYMERSLDMLVGLLAIMRAGGAYVPLDPAYPRDRLTYMLQDSGAKVLVTQQSLLGALGVNGLRALCVDGEWGPPGSEALRPASLGSLAYVIYTSGSMGRPKGVAISHRSLVNLLVSMGAEPGLGEDDALLSVTTLSFDIAGLELYLPLMVGARLVLVSREMAADGPALSERLASSGATVMQATPATWRLLVESGWAGTPGLKVLCGGEALPRDLATDLLTRVAEVWNVYGPTETTIWSSAWKVTSAAGPIPIGRPIANTSLYILDQRLNPLPVGVPGELFVGGHGLARGYWNRPELTAEKFLPDPFSSDRDARMYRTGDLARRLPDGTVDCLGRLDHQVKVRGFRIELGEIEAALDDHPSVRSTVVVAREDVPGLRALVAYLIADEPRERLVGALREWLRERLPEYMVPSQFVVLEAFPLTPNGKIDRKALPAPDHTGVEGGTTAPRTAMEEIVAGIFAEVLQRASVGVEGNFFDLGGHSLLATQMVSRVRKALGVELPLREIFNAPTVAGLTARIEALRGSGVTGEELEPIAAQPATDGRKLSASQRRLWFFDRLEPGSSAYNLAFRLILEGSLDLAALTRSLSLVVSRHETLRSRFEESDGEPRSIILPPSPMPLDAVDLRASSPADAEAEAARVLETDAQTPFDLEVGPLFRARLVRLSGSRHVMGLTLHHIVSDGWSIGVLVHEMLEAYKAIEQGREPDLPPLRFQYGDFAAWEARWLDGPGAKQQLDYWREHLAGPLPVVDLPTDSPRPKIQTFRGGLQAGRLSADLSERVAELSRKHGVTQFMTLLAAFALVVNRQTGIDDLPLGVPVAGRNRDGTDHLVGVFINTVVVRCDLQGDPSFAEVLRRTRSQALDAYRNADVPFDRVVDALHPRRDPGRTPLFQILVNSLDFSRHHRYELPGLTVEVRGGDVMATSKFDLTLYLGADDNGTGMALSYNADLFQAARMEALLAQIEYVLEQVTAHPDQRLSELSLLPPAANAQLPNPLEILDTAAGPPVLEGLSAHATRQPTKIAVTAPGASLDYASLERLSLGLARCLRAAGIAIGDVVAIRASRSADLVWGLCGVMRAGAGFMILDAAYPPARLAASIEAAGPRAWLESPGLPEVGAEVRALLGRPGWALKAVLEPELAEATTGPDEELAAADDDLAYIAFTSGTTGGVKGIWGGHGPLAHFLSWHIRTFGLAAEDRFSMISGLSHDPLLRDVFTPLRLGASIHIPDPDDILEPGRLRDWMAREGITVAHLTPAMARLLAQDATGGELPRLRYAFLGGDVLTRDEVRGLRRVAPTAQIVNFYGATETPQAMGWHRVPAEAEGSPLPLQMPIGRGIDDVQLLVLGKGGGLAGVGEIGEIAVRTPHLARGYVGDEALTRARFVTSPFSGQSKDRLYRTGDLARYRPDGSVEFAGRADTQVKIRGFRVELGEIDAALRELSLVSDVVTALAILGSGDPRLVSYVVPASSDPTPGPEVLEVLRAHSRSKLPSHMVPSSFIFLDALPLTPNGKIDRKALAKLDPGAVAVAQGGHRAPRTATEEILAGIWAEVLKVEKVGVDDDFFASGGHSLLATQVASRVRKALGVELALRELFDAPTVAAQAAHIDLLRSRDASAAQAPPLLAEPRSGPAELSYSQQRLWFIEQLEPGGSANVLGGGLAMRGRLEVGALERALATIVARHESLRTTFVSVSGTPTQHVSSPDPQLLPLVDLQGEADPRARVGERVREEVQRGFDLVRGPLFRAILYRLGPEDHVLLVCMHHIVSDGWSIGIIVRELSALYESGLRGEPLHLPAPPIQYRDFARWQRGWLQGEVLAAQVEHWRSRLAGAPQVLELPTDRPRPAAESHRGARLTVTLPLQLKDDLGALSRREGVTLFATLLAGFSMLLSRYTGQEDLLVGSPVANRNRAEVEGLIGFFVNTLILRTRLDGDPTVRELLARVREECLEAFTHQDLPFEKLVEDLRPERDASRNPLFQVMLVLQNAPQERLHLGDLELSPVSVDRGAAQLDLTLFVSEAKDGLQATFEYATDLFDESTIVRMAGHLRRLLEGMAASPESRASSLSLLTPEEEAQIAAWNAQDRDYPRGCVHELILEAARRDPHRIAAECGDARLTCGELDERSGRLAEHLRGLGVGTDVLVGIFMERSLDMLVGLLAILRAGGAYVPLDPAYPAERLAYMIERSRVGVVLTQTGLLESVPTEGLTAVCVDADSGEWRPGPPVSSHPSDLAYVIFTSGSTGQPKGVAISHGALLNLLVSMAREPGLGAEDTLLSVTTLSFDIAGLELYLPLLQGARLVLAERDEAADGRLLVERLATSGATVLQATPATWRLLLEAGWTGTPGIKVLCGGEALPRDLANDLLARAAEVWNVYGPTETTIWSSAWRVEGGDGTVPIGWPIANTTLHVLDHYLNLVPVGVGGELFIGGDGVARGYWERPDLTAERFLPDPFAKKPGARMYRTGDLARRLPDGSIECLGRVDHQVKVRGFRIELGEIEASLRRYPGIEGAVVLAQDVAGGDRRLVAYLSHGSNSQPNVTALRAHLKESLPTYMIPSSFVFLDRLPLTPNGKLDRKALAQLESGLHSGTKTHVEPRNPTEALIAELWQQALGVERVSVRDNFFDIGGHSLLAMRVLAAIEQRTGHRLHPRAIIFQTLEQIAASCAGSPEGLAAESPTEPRGITGRLVTALRKLVPTRSSQNDA